ncbi:probable 39S ribosomal protein L24, mitochondrial [Mercenaria mercenaria]|uniref:probable 39S ribosomal protein L24, mitochondrial n=1 Tax=Mercenaria mercenaria TaxID=6596 RepID=UPI00234E5B77|nr:probable 39S ribosomal protein L24, mitochondrial [Mercenaria mercenaria]
MAKAFQAVKQVFSRKKGAIYNGRGEEFKYWEKYMMREKANVRGPEIWRMFVGYKKKYIHDWYYDEHLPNTTISQSKQVMGIEMPLVKPIKEWNIYLGDRVEVLVGRDKGKIGEVVEIVKERNWCFVEGLHMEYKNAGSNAYKKYLRSYPKYMSSEKPLLVTNEVKLVDPADMRATDIDWRYTEEGERVRVSVRSGRVIPIPHKHKKTWEDFTRSWEVKATKKDTAAANVQKETYEPKLCTFEEDIAKSMGIELEKRPNRNSYWY